MNRDLDAALPHALAVTVGRVVTQRLPRVRMRDLLLSELGFIMVLLGVGILVRLPFPTSGCRTFGSRRNGPARGRQADRNLSRRSAHSRAWL